MPEFPYYIFAYGSLLSPDSLLRTVPGISLAECVPARCTGHVRNFGVAFPNDVSDRRSHAPHARGGEPETEPLENVEAVCSPRTWGRTQDQLNAEFALSAQLKDLRHLADRERILGPDHPDILTVRNNLAGAYLSAGRLGEAIPLYERTLADRERILGPDHPDTLTERNNLAVAYGSAGRLDEAIALFERTLTGRERILGADHPDTVASRNDLAKAYKSAGRLDEAIRPDDGTDG